MANIREFCHGYMAKILILLRVQHGRFMKKNINLLSFLNIEICMVLLKSEYCRGSLAELDMVLEVNLSWSINLISHGS